MNELATPFKLSQPTISKHLKVLERAGLISCGRDAQRRPRSLVRKPLEDATAWLKGYRNPGKALRLDAGRSGNCDEAGLHGASGDWCSMHSSVPNC